MRMGRPRCRRRRRTPERGRACPGSSRNGKRASRKRRHAQAAPAPAPARWRPTGCKCSKITELLAKRPKRALAPIGINRGVHGHRGSGSFSEPTQHLWHDMRVVLSATALCISILPTVVLAERLPPAPPTAGASEGGNYCVYGDQIYSFGAGLCVARDSNSEENGYVCVPSGTGETSSGGRGYWAGGNIGNFKAPKC